MANPSASTEAPVLMSAFGRKRTLAAQGGESGGSVRFRPQAIVSIRTIEAMRNSVLVILVMVGGCHPTEEDFACQRSSPARMTHQATAGDLSAVKKAGRGGKTTIEVLVGASGSNGYLADAKVVSSSGHPDLDKAAMYAVRYSEFEPAKCDGTRPRYRVGLSLKYRCHSAMSASGR